MKVIAAMDANRVIGYKGKLPWHLPDDFNWFKRATIGHVLIMGRTTFESVGELPQRYTYVISKQTRPKSEHHEYITYEKLLADPSPFSPIKSQYTWICGGAKVYQLLLPLCTAVYMTHVIDAYEGDTYMPPFEDMFPNQKIIMEHKEFWVVKYTR